MRTDDLGRVDAGTFVLRPLSTDDTALVVAAGRTDVPDWTFLGRDVDDDEARSWLERDLAGVADGTAVRFAIEVEGRDAGAVGGRHVYPGDPGIVETYYFVLPEFRRRGLAGAALRAFDQWVAGATPELRRLQLHVIVGNPGSGRVAESAGYRHEGVAVLRIPPVNGFPARDADVYARLAGTAQARGGHG